VADQLINDAVDALYGNEPQPPVELMTLEEAMRQGVTVTMKDTDDLRVMLYDTEIVF
jgi:hypothetical protein